MWSNILAQEKVKNNLRSLYESGKISHAYLFHGQEGTGKDAAAIEFAKLVNCLSPINSEACDKCDNCKSITSLKSRLLSFICALPSGKSGDSDNNPLENLAPADYEDYIQQLGQKSADPYYKLRLSNANNIKISSIRELVNKIYISQNTGDKKVFLISEADKMKQEAANALLKVLEEPPKNSMIILTTSRITSLPQTVIGRCHKIFFEPLSAADIREKLLKEYKSEYSSALIDISSKFSDGSYSRALELLELGIDEIRDRAIDYMIAILRKDYLNLTTIIKEISSRSDKSKLRYFFFFLNLWFRDLLKIKYFGENINKEDLANYDKYDRLQKFNKNFPEIDFYNIIMALEESERMIEQNISPQLIVTNLSFKIGNLVKAT
jgi:DNA polymerase-3 subunit delta'